MMKTEQMNTDSAAGASNDTSQPKFSKKRQIQPDIAFSNQRPSPWSSLPTFSLIFENEAYYECIMVAAVAAVVYVVVVDVVGGCIMYCVAVTKKGGHVKV
jgi:hypothetical protein